MYPLIRMAYQSWKYRGQPLSLFEPHISEHYCLPWDLDPWLELNNGRTLTLYDLGRVPLGLRSGLVKAMRAQGWGMTVAGNTTRYRRRIQAFQKVRMESRLIGWDARFVYIEQSMWRGGAALNHMLVRLAMLEQGRLMEPQRVVAAMGYPDTPSPALPDWVTAWIASESARPWPPMRAE